MYHTTTDSTWQGWGFIWPLCCSPIHVSLCLSDSLALTLGSDDRVRFHPAVRVLFYFLKASGRSDDVSSAWAYLGLRKWRHWFDARGVLFFLFFLWALFRMHISLPQRSHSRFERKSSIIYLDPAVCLSLFLSSHFPVFSLTAVSFFFFFHLFCLSVSQLVSPSLSVVRQ